MSEESKNPFDVDVAPDTTNPFDVELPVEKKNSDSTTSGSVASGEIPTVSLSESDSVGPSTSSPNPTSSTPGPKGKTWEQEAISKIFPYIQKRINANPDDEDALYQLGRAQLMMKDYNGAVNTFSGLTGKNPFLPEYKQGLANAMQHAGQQQQAQELQGEAIDQTQPESIESSEEEKLAPMRARMEGSRGVWEALATPATAPIHAFEASKHAFERAGEAIMMGDAPAVITNEMTGLVQAVMGATMTSEGGVVFNALASAPETYGISTEPIMAPLTTISKATGHYDGLQQEAKDILSIGDLVAVGIAMHAIGKPFSAAMEKPPTRKQVDSAIKNITPEQVTATLQHLENPEAAKLQQEANTLNKEIQNPALPPEAQAVLTEKLSALSEAMREQNKNFIEENLQKAETEKQAEALQAGVEVATTEEGKAALQEALKEIDPEILKSIEERKAAAPAPAIEQPTLIPEENVKEQAQAETPAANEGVLETAGERELPSESQVEPVVEAGEPVSEPVASEAVAKEGWLQTEKEYVDNARATDSYPEKDSMWERNQKALHKKEVSAALDKTYKDQSIKDSDRRKDMSEFEKAINEGRLSAEDAIKIIESAGLEVPKEISALKETKEPAPKPKEKKIKPKPAAEKELNLPENLKGQKDALLKQMNAAEEILLGEFGRTELDKMLADNSEGKPMTRDKLHEIIAPETLYADSETAIKKLRDAKFKIDDDGMMEFNLPKGKFRIRYKDLFFHIREVEKHYPTSSRVPDGHVRLGKPRDQMKGMEQGRYRSLKEFEDDIDFKALQENVGTAEKEIVQIKKWVDETPKEITTSAGKKKTNPEYERAQEAMKGAEMRKRIFKSYLDDWDVRHKDLKENTPEDWKNLNEAYDIQDREHAEYLVKEQKKLLASEHPLLRMERYDTALKYYELMEKFGALEDKTLKKRDLDLLELADQIHSTGKTLDEHVDKLKADIVKAHETIDAMFTRKDGKGLRKSKGRAEERTLRNLEQSRANAQREIDRINENKRLLKKFLSSDEAKKAPVNKTEYDDSVSENGELNDMSHGQVKGTFTGDPRMSPPPHPFQEGRTLEPIEIPELLQLAKELTGELPEARSMAASKRGFFKPIDELVAVNKKIFNDEEQVAKTLAHEIGHLIDYLPDKTMDRGNLLGRLFTLREFMKKTFGENATPLTPKERVSLRSEIEKAYKKELGVKSAHKFDAVQKAEFDRRVEERLEAETKSRGLVRDENIREELIAVSEYWRPYDKALAPESFKKYRNSAVELYADALSMLFNDPGRLNAMAPEFFQKYFEALDRKPEVKEAYLNTQDMINTVDAVNESRWQNTLIGFSKGKLKRVEIANKKPDAKKQNRWNRLQRDLLTTAVPILNKMQDAKQLGITLSEKQHMRNLLEALKYNENDIWLLNDKVDNDVIKPLELMGLGIDDLGVLGTIEKNLKGRENLANPLGIQSSSAKAMYEFAQKKYTPEQWEILTEAKKKFHDIIHDVYKQAHDQGMFTEDTWENVIEKDKEHYMTYQVADYIDKQYVSGRIIQAKGTFKEVENPVVSTMLKTISIIKAINRQKAIREFENIWKRDFPNEIHASEGQRTKSGDPNGFRDRENHGRIEYYKDGKWSGLDVDPAIAHIFEKYEPEHIGVVMKALSFANSKFKPMVTTYNLGFAFYSNIMRDNPRAFKNIMTIMMSNPSSRSFANALTYIPEYLAAYVKSFKHSKDYAGGKLTDLTKEMLEQKSLSATSFYFNDYDPNANENINAVHRRYNFMYKNLGLKDKPFDKFLDKHGPTRAFNKVLNGIQYAAAIMEYNTKITGYQILKKKLGNAEAAGFYVRNYVGTPNFLEKGMVTRQMNDVFIFSNVILQGLRSDVQLATKPATRGAYWLTHGISTLVPSMIMGAGMYGMFGDEIKKMYANMPEYMKSNYYCVPLGMTGEGKTVYWTLPMDDVSRLIHSITIKGNEAVAGDLKQPEQIVKLPLSMFPSEAPPIKVVSAWVDYLNGQNPKDDLYGRDIIGEKNFTAGGYYALNDMMKWSVNNTGVHLPFYNPTRETFNEYLVNNLPLFRRVIRESNAGVKEKLDAAGKQVSKERARELIAQDDVIKQVLAKAKSANASADNLDDYNEMLREKYFGDVDLEKDQEADQKRMEKLLRNYMLTGSSSPFSQATSAIINTTSDDQKIAKLQAYKNSVSQTEFQELINYLSEEKLIGKNVVESMEEE